MNIKSQYHSFSVKAASKVGVNAAVILQNLYFWVVKNEANGTNNFDGRYWTYNSVSAFCKLFPYMSKGQISGALRKLEDEGYIVSGNYNDNKYDRTKWYALTDDGYALSENCECISEKQEMDYREIENRISKTGECSISTDNKPDINTYMGKPKRRKHGEYGHVLLTDAEFESLSDKVDGYRDEYIRIVDEYCEQHGKSYKNYSLAIQNFYRRDRDEGRLPKIKRKPMTFGEYFG